MNTPDGATFKRPNLHMFCRLLSSSGTKNNNTIKNIDVIKLNNVAQRNASAFFYLKLKYPRKHKYKMELMTKSIQRCF